MAFSIQHFLPQRASSWLIRKLTRIETPWFKNAFIKYFAKAFKINWNESEITDIKEFKHFNAFFTRALKEGVRPLSNVDVVIPADGAVACAGKLDGLKFIRAKGHDFSLDALLADPSLAAEFTGGVYTTIYLSPRDYHRIHMPMTGTLRKMIHIPGKLYSVSLKTAVAIPTLFAQNERVVCVFDSSFGKFALVLVGAINVSSIETVWAGSITPPYGKVIRYTDYSDGIVLEKGAEMGRFNMGSTVIVIAQNSELKLDTSIIEDAITQMGAPFMSLS
jgi:phosphatidylserine decarboxylase